METPVIEKSNLKIEVLSDLEALSHCAASIFVGGSRNSIKTKKRFAVAISGGSTPIRLYALLASDPYRDKVEWRHIHFFWADERCVPKEDDESNFKLAYEAFLSKIPVPISNIHRVKGEKDPEQGAEEYEDDLRKFFGMSEIPVFDLIILGIGEDGHTASLFPDSKSLEETIRLTVPVYMKRPKRDRVTLTLPVLNNAVQILFLVSGRSKAKIIHKILGKKGKKERYPAGLITPSHGNIIWLIDQEAAANLPLPSPFPSPAVVVGN
jgi:6-phosphogluconolactonase